MKNTFHCGNLGLTATQLYCDSLTISYKKIINKICVEPLRINLGTFTQWNIYGFLMSFTHSKCCHVHMEKICGYLKHSFNHNLRIYISCDGITKLTVVNTNLVKTQKLELQTLQWVFLLRLRHTSLLCSILLVCVFLDLQFHPSYIKFLLTNRLNI